MTARKMSLHGMLITSRALPIRRWPLFFTYIMTRSIEIAIISKVLRKRFWWLRALVSFPYLSFLIIEAVLLALTNQHRLRKLFVGNDSPP